MSIYNIHVTTGKQNAILTMNAMGVSASMEMQELAIEASNDIIALMSKLINDGTSVSDNFSENVIDLLSKREICLVSNAEDKADVEQGSFFDRSRINYNWKERAEQLQIEIIKKVDAATMEEQRRKNEDKVSATIKANRIKKNA